MDNRYTQRIDDTRQAYLDALDRLIKNKPTHADLVGKAYKINAATIALESGKSRNPLYNTHKDILEMIQVIKKDNKETVQETKTNDTIGKLKQKIKNLEEENTKLLNQNAMLLFKSKNNVV